MCRRTNDPVTHQVTCKCQKNYSFSCKLKNVFAIYRSFPETDMFPLAIFFNHNSNRNVIPASVI